MTRFPQSCEKQTDKQPWGYKGFNFGLGNVSDRLFSYDERRMHRCIGRRKMEDSVLEQCCKFAAFPPERARRSPKNAIILRCPILLSYPVCWSLVANQKLTVCIVRGGAD